MQSSVAVQDLTQVRPSKSPAPDTNLVEPGLQAQATTSQGLRLSADLMWHSTVADGGFCIFGESSAGPHPCAGGPEHAEGRKALGQSAAKGSRTGVSSFGQARTSLPSYSMLGFASSGRFRVSAVQLPPGCCTFKVHVIGVGAFGGSELSHIAACFSVSVLLTVKKLQD